MTKRQPLETSEELVSAFADLFDEIEPGDPKEIDAVIYEAGYDPDEIAVRIRAVAKQRIKQMLLDLGTPAA